MGTAVLFCAGLGLLPASLALGQVTNSKHDFSVGGTGGIWASPDIDRVCVFCHVPHRATMQPVIWNRTNPVQTFTVYPQTASLNAVIGQPSLTSLRCLACHDGTTAVDAINQGRIGPTRMMALGDVWYPGSPWGEGGANIAGNYAGNPSVNNLGDDHPVSFVYDPALAAADGALRDPATIALPLFGGRVECSTCHDVHNTSGGFPYLLRMTNVRSALCLTCHDK